jgi:hypothetical protein
MATVKLTQVQEQNSATIAGMQLDTAVYVGTGLTGVVTLRMGRTAPVYVIQGTQTAVTLGVVLETENARQGDEIYVKAGTGACFGTSVLSVRSGGTAGTVISTASGAAAANQCYGFDGVAWR